MSDPILISEANLSYAWARAFLSMLENPLNNPPPLTITLTGFENGEPTEDNGIRCELTSMLDFHEMNSVDVSALVVFPYKAWIRRGRPSSKRFFKWCLEKYVPRLKARDRKNRRGLYFERMMQVCYYDEKGEIHKHNQLEYIIDWWKERGKIGRRPRRSGLQVSCFDPLLDHDKSPRPGFPCLQQVSFTYNDDGLAVNAFYPTQWIFDRAYGNYLGLCHLGTFMAHELGIELVRLNCFVARAELGSVTKSDVRKLEDFLHNVVPDQGG